MVMASPIKLLGPLHSSLGLIGLLRSPRLHYKSSEDPSSVAVDPMIHLLPLPLDPLGPCRPTPLAPVAVNWNQGSTRGPF